MLRIATIESFDRPELAPYRNMKEQVDHQQRGIFVAEGEKVVRRLLESGLAVTSVLFPPKWLDAFRPLLESRHPDVQVFLADKTILENLTGYSMYQGVLALAPVPPSLPLVALLEKAPAPRLLVAIDALATAENIGGLVRSCVAFGVQGLIVGETSSSPYLRRAVRSSMGTIFQLPVVETFKLVQTIRDLRSHGVRCVAAHPHTREISLSRADFTTDCCIVFGSEGYGISPPVLAECDQAVAIPMPPAVDSLNVGNAAAVFLYEAARQRGRM